MNPVDCMAATTEMQSVQHAIARLAQGLADTSEMAFAILAADHKLWRL